MYVVARVRNEIVNPENFIVNKRLFTCNFYEAVLRNCRRFVIFTKI